MCGCGGSRKKKGIESFASSHLAKPSNKKERKRRGSSLMSCSGHRLPTIRRLVVLCYGDVPQQIDILCVSMRIPFLEWDVSHGDELHVP